MTNHAATQAQHAMTLDDALSGNVDPLTVFTYEDYKHWKLDFPLDKETTLFDGRSEAYADWRDMIVDHCATHWFRWRGVLTQLLNFDYALTTEKIFATNSWLGLNGAQLVVLSNVLWSHLGRCMTETQRRSRKRTAGEELNGLELWRKLHWGHHNGETPSDICGAQFFNMYPRCSNFEHLQAQVDDWKLLRQEVGAGIPDGNILPMFLAILPTDYQAQLEEDPTVKTFKDALSRVEAKCRRLNQNRLAKLAQTKREDAVKRSGSSQSFVHMAASEPPADAPATPVAELAKQLENMSTVMAAMQKQLRGRAPARGPRTSPRRDSKAVEGRGVPPLLQKGP